MSLEAGIAPIKFFWRDSSAENITDYLYQKYVRGGAGYGGVSTSGSSTTITGATGGNIPAPPLAVLSPGDIVVFRYAGTVLIRTVLTVAADNLTAVLTTAVDLSNGCSGWEFFKRYRGTTDADGWVFVGDQQDKAIFFDFDTLTNPVDISIEEKGGHGLANEPIQVFTTIVVAVADIPTPVVIGEQTEFIRVGIRAATIATDPDVFTAYLQSRPVR